MSHVSDFVSRVPVPAPVFNTERNGPIVTAELRSKAAPAVYSVVTLAYDRAHCRAFHHRTMAAAIRRLASVCDSGRGVHYRRGEFAAAIVRPDGHVMSLIEARTGATA